MSQAEALLNQVSMSGMYTASPATEPHIVIGADRVITIPDELKRLGVQFDHNIETIVFDCPRYWDDTDMSTMSVYINYERKDGVRGKYLADNVTVDASDETMMHFEWTISKHATLVDGKLVFNVCIKSVDDEGLEDEHWNSEICEDGYISKGLESGTTIEGAYPDIITQLRTRMDNILNSGMAVDVSMQKVDDTLMVRIVAPENTETFYIYDGKTPYIGANGNWWIGDEDTGVTAAASTVGMMPSSVYDPQSKQTDIFKYVEDNGVSAADREKWDAKSNFSGKYADLIGKPTLFDGKYSSLSGRPTIPTVENSVTSTSTTNAASAAAVKQAYDKATEAMNSSGTNTAGNVTVTTTDGTISVSTAKYTQIGNSMVFILVHCTVEGVNGYNDDVTLKIEGIPLNTKYQNVVMTSFNQPLSIDSALASKPSICAYNTSSGIYVTVGDLGRQQSASTTSWNIKFSVAYPVHVEL